MMRILDDMYPDDFLIEREDDFSTDLYEEGEAVALEDLLHLVQESVEYSKPDLRPAHFATDEDALVWGLSVLCETKLGRDLAYDARFEDWSIEVDDIEQASHIIDPQLRILILPRFSVSPATLARSQNDRASFLMELARGLRGVWHDMTGVRDDADLTADDQILWERLRAADHDLCAVRMAWDLREQGMGGLWRQIIASHLGDLAVMAGELWATEDQNEQSEKNLPLYGFSHLVLEWLRDASLVNATDGQTLDAMDLRLQRNVREVCGPEQISAVELMTLSTLPSDGSYLAPVARTVMYAAEFREIPDGVNEAYLRQILEDCELTRISPLVFSDSELEKKFFPDRVDTIA
ncbi:MAG: hypothetical protein PHX61_05020 [Alphaproteobacteria bacterium]|nr:hypothetical protein [Alphaproteobacteria bacterium]